MIPLEEKGYLYDFLKNRQDVSLGPLKPTGCLLSFLERDRMSPWFPCTRQDISMVSLKETGCLLGFLERDKM